MTATDDAVRRQLKTLAAGVLPGLGVGVTRVGDASLRPEEAPALCHAVPSRQQEFAAGRMAARTAMRRDLTIPQGPDRAPLWPEGIAGSISHAGGWAIAATSTRHPLVGIDLEADADLPVDIWEAVLLPAERRWLQGQTDPARWAMVIFCAKECAYKAQYPLSRCLFGFEVLEVRIDAPAGSFQAEFQQDVPPFRRGSVLTGRFARGGGFILTGVAG